MVLELTPLTLLSGVTVREKQDRVKSFLTWCLTVQVFELNVWNAGFRDLPLAIPSVCKLIGHIHIQLTNPNFRPAIQTFWFIAVTPLPHIRIFWTVNTFVLISLISCGSVSVIMLAPAESSSRGGKLGWSCCKDEKNYCTYLYDWLFFLRIWAFMNDCQFWTMCFFLRIWERNLMRWIAICKVLKAGILRQNRLPFSKKQVSIGDGSGLPSFLS